MNDVKSAYYVLSRSSEYPEWVLRGTRWLSEDEVERVALEVRNTSYSTCWYLSTNLPPRYITINNYVVTFHTGESHD